MSKNKTFEWTKDCEFSFKTLKEKFETQPVLAMPDPLKLFEIECDTSMNATGTVLYQNDINGAWHPIAYFSKGFTPAEQNYHCSEQEFFAIILALREWRHYIQGSPHLTVIWTDHENLTRWRKPQQLSRRQVRWTQDIQEFNVLIKHLPGKKNGPADALSRRPDHVPAEKDNHDMIALPDNLFDDKRVLPITIIDEEDLKDIKATKGFENLPRKDGKIEIPGKLSLQRHLLQRVHDIPTAGHPGTTETLRKLQDFAYWPGMNTFVRNYVRGCDKCQQYKIN